MELKREHGNHGINRNHGTEDYLFREFRLLPRILRSLLQLTILIALILSLTALPAEAAQRRGKKGKPPEREVAVVESRREAPARSVTPPPRAKAKQSAPAPSRRLRRQPVAQPEPAPPVQAPTSADYSSARIEAIEYNSPRYHQVSRQISQPPGGQTADAKPRVNVSNRRIEVDIAPERVIEIQKALIEKRLLTGEPTGVYDEATIEAMRQFQHSQQIDVTGYPTAHSLKRLGLTK